MCGRDTSVWAHIRLGAIDKRPRGRYRKLGLIKLRAQVMEPEKNARLSGALFAKVTNAAQEENKTPDELVEEAVELYLENRRWQKLLDLGEKKARDLGLEAEDELGPDEEPRREQ
jgi:hypothetical protein